MKRAVSISFLVLANILLLAHALVPHHHHGRAVVCVVKYNCSDCDFGHDRCQHGQDADSHRHDGKSSSEECALFDIYARFDNNENKVACHDNCDCGESLFIVLPRVLDISGLADDYWLPFRQAPFIETYYSGFVTHSSGMRAPPVC